jgi:diguanylate cyclase (GGDEF)-like protein
VRQKFFIKNPLYLILSTLAITLVLVVLLYTTVKLEEKIEKRMIEISTSDVMAIAHNSANAIKHQLDMESDIVEQILTNETLHRDIEKNLKVLLTQNIKYSYLLYRDKKGIFRFLADGAKEEEKAFLNQKFDIDNPKWLEVFQTKQPVMIEHQYLQQLSISYLVPVVHNNEVQMVLAIDFSIKKVENINSIIALMKNAILAIILVVVVFLIVLLIQTLRYIAIKKTAYIDKLTHVYNRNYLQESEDFINLNDYLLATLDIDYFKTVNDTYGHDVGDKILKQVANMILLTIRTHEDIVIRYGGEEFVILAKIKRGDHLSALNVIERIFKNIQENHFYINKKDYLNITVSIGVNLVPHKSRTFSEAFKLADIALYNAKNKGRNNIEIYDEIHNHHNQSLMSINDIKEAIEENRVVCFYQKIVDTFTQKVSHYEALLRIVDKQGNIVTPDKILPVIKGTFILRNITKSVLAICHEKLSQHPTACINVNLNPKDIIDDTILDILKEYAQQTNIAERLGIEIVESEDLITCKDAKDNLLMLKQLGYKIFIDDFGSGYSNFIYLTQIKTDFIKIDGAIIKNILDDKISFLLVKSIVDFAKEANIKVIAEYVSKKEIYDTIKSLGIEYSQGFYFSQPKAFEE